MNKDEIERILERITYRSGFTFHVYEDAFGVLNIEVRATVENANDYRGGIPLGLGWFNPLPADCDYQTLMHWIWQTLDGMESHERLEWLKIDGQCAWPAHGDLLIAMNTSPGVSIQASGFGPNLCDRKGPARIPPDLESVVD